MARRKVAIIGCGAAGLTAIKCCIDAGLQPICFEQQPWLGGVWKYSDQVLPDIPSVHHGTVTNTSKIMTAFSDFPMPKEFPNYLPQRTLQEYLEMYAKHFCLEQYIQFNTRVVTLARSDDHRETGRWVISCRRQSKISSECDGIDLVESFDAVMVCNGHYWDLAKPKIPGIERFNGIQIHSGEYRTFHPFAGKRVVVVGGGNSAGDIACELGLHASQVYLSTRSGCYIIGRLATKGKPIDFQVTRALQCVPQLFRKMFFLRTIYGKYNLVNYGLEPTGTLGVQSPIVNDALPHRITTGSVIVKHDVTEVTETAVVFSDEDMVDNIDAIVFCTGFKLNFPFSKGIICVKEDCYMSLYKHVFLPDANSASLAVIGSVSVNGPLLPVQEMQARVAAEVFAGRCTLPSKDTMVKTVERREQQSNEAGVRREKMMRVDFVSYIDDLAAMIGVKPNLWALLWDDPKLAFQCFFGPCLSAQYRLQGPNSSSKCAKRIINSVEENYLFPLKTRECRASRIEKGNSFTYILYVVIIVLVILIVFLY